MTHEETAKLFGFKNPGPATIVKDVKTKMGLAFKKGEEVTVYESGVINSGPYIGKMGYAAYSALTGIFTAILPCHFKELTCQ